MYKILVKLNLLKKRFFSNLRDFIRTVVVEKQIRANLMLTRSQFMVERSQKQPFNFKVIFRGAFKNCRLLGKIK